MYFRRDEARKLNPWHALPEAGDFVLPQERSFIEAYNATQTKSEDRVRLDIPPAPFVGSPETARVLLLTKTPPWDAKVISDYAEYPDYAEAVRRNLVFANEDYPFYYLNPAFSETCGYQWWTSKLREVIEACQEKLGPEAAFAALSKRIMTIAYFPYHVEKYAGTVKDMPSQKFSFGLAGALARDGMPVVIQSHGKLWDKQLSTERGIVINTGSSQSNFFNRTRLPAAQFEEIIDILTKD